MEILGITLGGKTTKMEDETLLQQISSKKVSNIKIGHKVKAIYVADDIEQQDQYVEGTFAGLAEASENSVLIFNGKSLITVNLNQVNFYA